MLIHYMCSGEEVGALFKILANTKKHGVKIESRRHDKLYMYTFPFSIENLCTKEFIDENPLAFRSLNIWLLDNAFEIHQCSCTSFILT